MTHETPWSRNEAIPDEVALATTGPTTTLTITLTEWVRAELQYYADKHSGGVPVDQIVASMAIGLCINQGIDPRAGTGMDPAARMAFGLDPSLGNTGDGAYRPASAP